MNVRGSRLVSDWDESKSWRFPMKRRVVLVLTSLLLAALSMPARSGDDKSPRADARPVTPEVLAHRIWVITDAVLEHHVTPPARQTMLLAALQALATNKGHRPSNIWSKRVSQVTTE